jgi:hypothetical protein
MKKELIKYAKEKTLSTDNWIDVFEKAIEMQDINDDLGKKTSVRDIMISMTQGKKVDDQFKAFQSKVESLLPRLVYVLLLTATKDDFAKSCNVHDIFNQLNLFAQKIMKKNSKWTIKTEQTKENTKTKDGRHYVKMNCEVNSLDNSV